MLHSLTPTIARKLCLWLTHATMPTDASMRTDPWHNRTTTGNAEFLIATRARGQCALLARRRSGTSQRIYR